MPSGRRFDAVLFDFNGVITSSPFDHMGALGEASGVTPERVLELMLGPYDEDTNHAWHRMERGESASVSTASTSTPAPAPRASPISTSRRWPG